MANVKINALTLKSSPELTDEVEIQETGGNTSYKATLSGLGVVLGSTVDGLYGDSVYLANDTEYSIADFITGSELAYAIIIVVTDTTVSNPSAIFSCDGVNLSTVYLNTGSFDNGDTSNNNTNNKINIWLDTTTTPDSIKVKNRTGAQKTFRFFVMSWSASA